MAELTTLARPYAKAAFLYAKEINAIVAWEQLLVKANAVVADESFASLLGNPAVLAQQKADVLLDVIAPVEEIVDSPMKQVLDSVQLPEGVSVESLVRQVTPKQKSMGAFGQFIVQLAQNDRLALLPEIYTHFSKLKSQELKQVDAFITSAYPLSDEQRQLLQKSLAEREQAIVILHEAVDESLLGGATIKVGDKFTDGSVRGKLTQLKTQLL